MNAKIEDEYPSQAKRNHRVVVTQHGGSEVLQMIEDALPEPGPGEVRVRLKAVGVSAYDLMQRSSGSLPGVPKVPYTPGEDIAGVVDKLGDGVTDLDLGQAVAGYPCGGGYAEFICLPASEAVPIPEGVDPAQAVCLAANYLTALLMMHRVAGVQTAERIPLAEAARAHELLGRGGHAGKVVLVPGP